MNIKRYVDEEIYSSTIASGPYVMFGEHDNPLYTKLGGFLEKWVRR